MIKRGLKSPLSFCYDICTIPYKSFPRTLVIKAIFPPVNALKPRMAFKKQIVGKLSKAHDRGENVRLLIQFCR